MRNCAAVFARESISRNVTATSAGRPGACLNTHAHTVRALLAQDSCYLNSVRLRYPWGFTSKAKNIVLFLLLVFLLPVYTQIIDLAKHNYRGDWWCAMTFATNIFSRIFLKKEAADTDEARIYTHTRAQHAPTQKMDTERGGAVCDRFFGLPEFCLFSVGSRAHVHWISITLCCGRFRCTDD